MSFLDKWDEWRLVISKGLAIVAAAIGIAAAMLWHGSASIQEGLALVTDTNSKEFRGLMTASLRLNSQAAAASALAAAVTVLSAITNA